MNVKDGVRTWSIILYNKKPHIILSFCSIENNKNGTFDTVEIAEWIHSIDVASIRDTSFGNLILKRILYSKIEECKVLLSW